jgi:hypothetical protein
VETVQSFLKKLKVELSYDVPKGNEGSIQKWYLRTYIYCKNNHSSQAMEPV